MSGKKSLRDQERIRVKFASENNWWLYFFRHVVFLPHLDWVRAGMTTGLEKEKRVKRNFLQGRNESVPESNCIPVNLRSELAVLFVWWSHSSVLLLLPFLCHNSYRSAEIVWVVWKLSHADSFSDVASCFPHPVSLCIPALNLKPPQEPLGEASCTRSLSLGQTFSSPLKQRPDKVRACKNPGAGRAIKKGSRENGSSWKRMAPFLVVMQHLKRPWTGGFGRLLPSGQKWEKSHWEAIICWHQALVTCAIASVFYFEKCWPVKRTFSVMGTSPKVFDILELLLLLKVLKASTPQKALFGVKGSPKRRSE